MNLIIRYSNCDSLTFHEGTKAKIQVPVYPLVLVQVRVELNADRFARIGNLA